MDREGANTDPNGAEMEVGGVAPRPGRQAEPGNNKQLWIPGVGAGQNQQVAKGDCWLEPVTLSREPLISAHDCIEGTVKIRSCDPDPVETADSQGVSHCDRRDAVRLGCECQVTSLAGSVRSGTGLQVGEELQQVLGGVDSAEGEALGSIQQHGSGPGPIQGGGIGDSRRLSRVYRRKQPRHARPFE